MNAELVHAGSVDVALECHAYLPVEWDFGDDAQDGIGNPAPADSGTIYIVIGECDVDDDPAYLAITLAGLVDYALDGWCNQDGLTAEMHHRASDRLAVEFRRLANLLDSRKSLAQKPASPMKDSP